MQLIGSRPLLCWTIDVMYCCLYDYIIACINYMEGLYGIWSKAKIRLYCILVCLYGSMISLCKEPMHSLEGDDFNLSHTYGREHMKFLKHFHQNLVIKSHNSRQRHFTRVVMSDSSHLVIQGLNPMYVISFNVYGLPYHLCGLSCRVCGFRFHMSVLFPCVRYLTWVSHIMVK